MEKENVNQEEQILVTQGSQISFAKQKGYFLPLLGVILITLLVGGAYYLGTKNNNLRQLQPITTNQVTPQPTQNTNQTSTTIAGQDETANWETYANIKYGISFKYPTNLILKTAQDYGKQLMADFTSADYKIGLQIVVALTREDLFYGHGLEGMKPVSDTLTKVGLSDAQMFIYETDTDNPGYVGDPIAVLYGVEGVKDKPLLIEYGGEKDKASLYEFNQILSTFKFTN